MTAVDSVGVSESTDLDEEADLIEKTVRYNILRYMKLLNLTQVDLVEPLHLTKGPISLLLSGESRLKFRQVVIIARVLGVSVDDLMDPTAMFESERQAKRLMERSALFSNAAPRFFVNPEADRMVPSVGLEPTLRRF